MTGTEAVALVAAVVVAFDAWWIVFRLDRRDIWPRSLAVGIGLCVFSVAASAWLGRREELLGPVSAKEAGIGAAVGLLWLAATQIGARLIVWLMPRLEAELTDLYKLGVGDHAARIVAPLLAMSAGEELLFRGLLQGIVGVVGGIVIYAAVQAIEGKWMLVVAAVASGAVWASLAHWRGGLVAALVCHAVWTVVLTVVWPLPSRAPDRIPAEP